MTSTVAPPREVTTSRGRLMVLIAVPSVVFGLISGTTVDAVLPTAAFALVWAVLAGAVAPWLIRKGAQSSAWANAPLYLASPLAFLVLGGALLGQLLSGTPESALALFRQPNFGLFFVTVHVLFEWVLLPAMLMLNWHDRTRRKLLLAAAVIFYLGRISSALYFAPNALTWGDLPANTAPSTALLDDIRLWVNLNLVRMLLQDTATAVLVFAAAVRRPAATPELNNVPASLG